MISNQMGDIEKLSLSVIVVLVVGFLGSLTTTPELATWYLQLNKPVWTPPNWVFGPIWTTLYILMGIALFLVWKEGLSKKFVKIGIFVFAVQLILNFLWSLIFFSFNSLIGGLILIILLWISILINIVLFYRMK